MRENDLHKIYESLTLTKQQGEQMWAAIQQGKEKRIPSAMAERQKQTTGTRWGRFAVAAVLVLLLWGTGAAVNAATDGGVVRQILKWIQPATDSQTEQDIVDEAVDLGEEGMETYAPDILMMDEKYLIFGNLRGILVYDLKRDKLIGSIDTQKIDCIHFESGQIQSILWKEDDMIYLWNERDKKLQGKVHPFQIQKEDGDEKGEKLVAMDEAANGQEISQKYHNQKRKNKVDTFRKLSGWAESEKKLSFLLKGEETLYSENAYELKNAAGEKTLNFLTLQGKKYCLYECNMQTKKLRIQQLCLTAKERKNRKLPDFEYTGDNTALAAIISYQQKRWKELENDGCFVPEYVIYKMVQKNDEYLVFGNFYEEGYRKVGNVLQSLSGGEMPACFHLVKDKKGYRVKKVERAGDGAYYAESIRKFTKGYAGLYEEFMKDTGIRQREWKKAKKKYLKMYVKEHDLDVKMYKDSGWDADDF